MIVAITPVFGCSLCEDGYSSLTTLPHFPVSRRHAPCVGARAENNESRLGTIVEVELVGDQCESLTRVCPNVDAVVGSDSAFEQAVGLQIVG